MEESEYEKDLQINPSALDVELLMQPIRFSKYAKLAAHAERRVKHAEERVKAKRSELVLRAHREPDVIMGTGVKASAQTVEAYYRTHKDYIALKQELHEEEYKRDLLSEVAVKAFQMRKTSLENLVRLAGQNYFATPTIPRDLPKEYSRTLGEAEEEIEKELTERMLRRAQKTTKEKGEEQ